MSVRNNSTKAIIINENIFENETNVETKKIDKYIKQISGCIYFIEYR